MVNGDRNNSNVEPTAASSFRSEAPLLVVSLSINRLARVIAAGTSEFIWPGLYDQRAFVARPGID
jgi:hypothetical protein